MGKTGGAGNSPGYKSHSEKKHGDSTQHFVTTNISIDMRLISLFIVCAVITRGGTLLKRIEAKVADEFESGTDCDVSLELMNPGETKSCKTGILDEPHVNNWARAGKEVYNFAGLCNGGKTYLLKPSKKLQFRVNLGPKWNEALFRCIDHMQLVSLRVYFSGGRYFHWSGKHWFTPTSDWMSFDFEGQTG